MGIMVLYFVSSLRFPMFRGDVQEATDATLPPIKEKEGAAQGAALVAFSGG